LQELKFINFGKVREPKSPSKYSIGFFLGSPNLKFLQFLRLGIFGFLIITIFARIEIYKFRQSPGAKIPVQILYRIFFGRFALLVILSKHPAQNAPLDGSTYSFAKIEILKTGLKKSSLKIMKCNFISDFINFEK